MRERLDIDQAFSSFLGKKLIFWVEGEKKNENVSIETNEFGRSNEKTI